VLILGALVVSGFRYETRGVLRNGSGLCGPAYNDAGEQVADYGPCPSRLRALECGEWRWVPPWATSDDYVPDCEPR
jgi:hypothetical protein